MDTLEIESRALQRGTSPELAHNGTLYSRQRHLVSVDATKPFDEMADS